MTVVPQWPYLVETDGSISLQPPEGPGDEATLGDSCGEWAVISMSTDGPQESG
jgi:hypothetical protein